MRHFQRGLAIGLLLLASAPAGACGQAFPDEPRFRGLALHPRAVVTSEWRVRSQTDPEGAVSYSYTEMAASGLGLEAAYVLGHGAATYVAADYNLQQIHSGWGGFSGYGTLAVGIRVRHPLSRRVVPFVQAAIARLRLAAPVYTQPFLGAGTEFFIGRRLALSAALELPVSGSSSLEKRPHRFLIGTVWYLGSRESRSARADCGPRSGGALDERIWHRPNRPVLAEW